MEATGVGVGERTGTRLMLYQEMEDAQRCLSLTGSLIECELGEFVLRETAPLFMLSTESSRPVVDALRYGPLPLSNQRMIAWPILQPDMVVPHLVASNDIATINEYRSFCR
jgi:hypothetical protein